MVLKFPIAFLLVSLHHSIALLTICILCCSSCSCTTTRTTAHLLSNALFLAIPELSAVETAIFYTHGVPFTYKAQSVSFIQSNHESIFFSNLLPLDDAVKKTYSYSNLYSDGFTKCSPFFISKHDTIIPALDDAFVSSVCNAFICANGVSYLSTKFRAFCCVKLRSKPSTKFTTFPHTIIATIVKTKCSSLVQAIFKAVNVSEQ